jgi:hypothetical protein
VSALALPDDLARVVADHTKGWPADRKRALAVELRREAKRRERLALYPHPLELACALESTWVRTPALELISRKLADLVLGRAKRNRLLITMSPQEGKSQTVSHYGALWTLMLRPEWRLALVSYELEVATQWGRAVRDDIEAHGSTATDDDGTPLPDKLGLAVRRNTRAASRWVLDGHKGGMVCVGIGGPLTSRPVDALWIDDPLKNREQADSTTISERNWGWYTHVARTRFAPGTIVVCIQTRWAEDDLAGRLYAADLILPEHEREWEHVNIPAQSEAPQEGITPDALDRPPGVYMISARGRTVEDWERTRRDVGERAWAALFQQRPSPAEGGVWKWEWINDNRVPPQSVPALVKVAVAVDPAESGKHDEAGIVVGGRAASGHRYVLADLSGLLTPAQWSRRALLACLDYRADALVYERNFAPATMQRTIRAAWRRLLQQARALRLARGDADAAARTLLAGLVDPDLADDPPSLERLVAELEDLLPYVDRVLASGDNPPAVLVAVQATRGKRTRAEPVAQAYETGMVHHAGRFPILEGQQTTWQEGQDSPDRLDAATWLDWYLASAVPGKAKAATAGQVPTGAATAVGQRTGGVPTGAGVAARR